MSKKFENKLQSLNERDQEHVQWMVAQFHYRTGNVGNHDGSMGEIKITPKELRDALAAAMLRGEHD